MRLYVCWDTAASHPLFGEHPCGIAHRALREAGHDPEVVRSYGWTKLPAIFNQTPGRRAVRELTGSDEVPVLVLEDGEVVAGSEQIVFWAQANPAAQS
jgi:hypothetical protein